MLGENDNRSRLGFSGKLLLLTAFFISGAASLIFEVIWTRILLISIGATAIAVGAVLGAFMAGMAVGSYLAGRRFVLRFNPVLLYAILEGWIGLYGLATPYLLRLAAPASPVVQFIAAVIVILPATVAMGVSLPLLSRAFGSGSKWKAFEVGRLYAANTAGAVVGPLVAVFWLFPALGLRQTLHVAAAADILIFAGVLFMDRLLGREAIPGVVVPISPTNRVGRPGILLLTAMAVSGATAMVYEVAWARTLSLVYGSSVYGTSIMLATFLLGLACGSALASFILRRKGGSTSLNAPAWLLVGSAAGAYVSLLLARHLPFIFLKLTDPAHELSLFITQFVISLLLMLPATLCLGAMLPVATRISDSTSKAELGRQVSWLYTANLLGSAVGPIIAAGLLMGSFGIKISVRAASLLALFVALLLTIRKPRSRFSMAGTVVAVVAVLVVLLIDPKGEPVSKGYGFYNDPGYRQYDSDELKRILSAHRTLYYRDGPTATVCVHQVDRYKALKINGKNEGSNGPRDLETKTFLAHLPLLASEAKEVAIIGLGSGMTAGAVLTHPVEGVDVFEIEPAVVEASRFFDDLSGNPLQDKRLRLIMGDARSQLLAREKIYDLIISEPSNPWITGVANLFTKDFFTLAASRLKEKGILCQWFHLYGMTEASTRSLIATYRSVFPHTLVFKYTDLIILGSRQPIRFGVKRMQRIFRQTRVGESLSHTFVRYLFDMLIRIALDEKGVETYSRGAEVNTDDNLLLELATPKSVYLSLDTIEAIRAGMDRHSHSVSDLISGYTSKADVYLELAVSYFAAGQKEEARRHIIRALEIEDSFHGRRMLGQTLISLGRNEEARRALNRALSLGGDEQGRQFVENLLRSLPPTANK